MTIVDSNVWVARLSETDSQHARAKEVFAELEGSHVLLPEYIVVEVCTALVRKEGKERADAFIDLVRDNSEIEFHFSDPSFFNTVLRLFRERSDGGLSFTDVALLSLAQTHVVITFDRALEKAISDFRT